MSDKLTYEQIKVRLTNAENELRSIRTLYKAATAIESNFSLIDTLKRVAKSISESLKSAGCAISIWHRDQNHLETYFDYNRLYPDETDKPGTIYDLKDYPSSLEVLKTGQPHHIQLNDPKADKAEIALMKAQEVFSAMMIPLKTKNRTLGLLEIYEDVGSREYMSQEIHLAESLAFQASVAIENAQLYENAKNEIIERKQLVEDKERLIAELKEALDKVTALKGIVPICQHCKKVRDDKGYWNRVEAYISLGSDSDLSHSICPECAKSYWPDMDLYDDEQTHD